MTSTERIRPGLSVRASERVTLDRTAPHVGSGTLSVYATPAMVLFVERTCARMIVEHLPESQTTVGVEVNVRHLAPTPLDGEVHIEAEITAVEGDLVTFQARLWDEIEEVGQAHHRRMIIDRERFLRRVKSKAASAS